MAEENRFVGERAVATILITALSGLLVWAGSTVVQSRQDNAVMAAQLLHVQAAIGEMKTDIREIKTHLNEAWQVARRAQNRLNQIDPGNVPVYTPPAQPYPQDVQPPVWRAPPAGSPVPGPAQGGR